VSASAQLAEKLLTALRGLPGLRPATPSTVLAMTWVPWDWDTLAIDLEDEVVVIRVVATKLPLPPLVGEAEKALRAVLAASGRPTARLRVEITDIDGAAFGCTSRQRPSPAG
jgi:hypothetical protein